MKITLSHLLKLVVLISIDFILIWLWVNQMNPDPSVSIALILLVPLIFVVNLIISGVFYFLKKREYSRLFIINSVMASFIMSYLFQKGIDQYQENRFDSWEFTKADTTFLIIRWKETSDFDMSYSTSPGSSIGFLSGKCETINDTYILTTDSTKYIIKDRYLLGFRGVNDTIEIKKEVR